MSRKLLRPITIFTFFALSVLFMPIQYLNWASADESLSLTTLSGTWDPSYVSGVAELSYLANSNSDIYSVEFALKVAPAGAAVNVQLLSSSAKNANLKNTSSSTAVLTPNISEPQLVSAYIKIQVCDLKNGCAGQISVLGTYVVSVISTNAVGVSKSADIVMKVEAPTSKPDTEAPKVDWQNSGISKTQISYGEEVSAKVRITDNVGTNEVIAYFYANSPISGSIGAQISTKICQRYSGDQKDGYWQCTGLVLKEKLSKDDRYSIAFDARDSAGNLALGQSIGGVTVANQIPNTPGTNPLIPTNVIIEVPTQYTGDSNGKPVYQINLDANGQANAQVMAFVQPVDLSKLPTGRSSLDVELVFKGSGGPGCPQQPIESIGTYKEGYKFFFLNYKLNSTGICTGTFQFYGDSVYEKTNYPTFTFNVLSYVNLGEISVSDVSLYSQSVSPGGVATVYYWVKNPKNQSTAGLGAGIGDFGVDPGPFGDEISSIGWTLGVVKGDSVNGLYKSNIPIPLTAKPGTYRTWVFWKGITGPIYGPDLTIVGSVNDENDALKNFSTWVQDAQAFYSNLVIQAVNAKLGDGGYRYINLRPEPNSDYYKYPSIEKFGLYKTALSKWADYEIANIKVENFIKSDSNSPSKSDLQKICETQSAATAKSLKESDVQLSYLNRRISNLQSLDLVDRQAEYNSITSEINSIASNLATWINKLPVYLSSNPDCSDYSKHLIYANGLYSALKIYSAELNKIVIQGTVNATYIKLLFTGNNQSLAGESIFLDGIDSTGNGRGSIEVNAFLRAYETKLMFGNQSLNYQVSATTSTPKICKISTPRYFLGTENPFTKFSLIPLSEGECLLNFVGKVLDRKDLSGAATTWNINVRSTSGSSGKDISTELNDDGMEVEPAANLSISKLNNGRYTIKVDSNLESEQVEIYASKKGFKTIKFSANTGTTTQLKITTSRNLKGYTLVIRFNGEVLDKLSVK